MSYLPQRPSPATSRPFFEGSAPSGARPAFHLERSQPAHGSASSPASLVQSSRERSDGAGGGSGTPAGTGRSPEDGRSPGSAGSTHPAPAGLPSGRSPEDFPGYLSEIRTLDEVEREAILRALKITRGNVTLASERLGVTARTLRNKIRRYRAEGHAIPGRS